MDGRAKSEEWLQYGPVYRLWAGPQPEMYVIHPLRQLICSSNWPFSLYLDYTEARTYLLVS